MFNLKRISVALLFTLTLIGRASAQDLSGAAAQKSSTLSLTITATATSDRVRITAPSSVVQMHVEVYGAGGERVFDNEIRGGNVFDWRLQDGQAQRLAAGEYVCVVTVKSISGRLTQKLGTVSVGEKEVRVGPAETAKLTFVQQQTIGPIEDNSSWTIVDDKENPTTTVIAHNGTEGQVIRGRGALSFRLGNFFTGNDKEQMRLTEAGDLGIGTENPQARLDVAGTIRAQRVLIAKPSKSVNTPGLDASQTSSGDVQPLTSGTGTQNTIAKWIDGAGTLGDSIATEVNGDTLDVGGRLTLSGNKTLSTTLAPMLGVNTTINNTGLANVALSVRGATFTGPGDIPTGLDVAPTFAPSSNISTAQGFTAAAYAAPPPGVTIGDQFGGNSTIVYNNVSGAVTNGTNFNIAAPVILGALKPTTQTGLRIRNQGIAGTTNAYGLYVDAQSGSANTYSAVFAGGNVGIGIIAPLAPLHVSGVGPTRALVDSDRNAGLALALNGQAKWSVATVTGNQFQIYNDATQQNAVWIDSASNNVGIGTNAPGSKLHVNVPSSTSPISAASIDVQSFSTPSNAVASHFLRVRDIGSGGPSAFFIRGDGNVGIGTDAPAQKLTVTGMVQSTSGGFKFPDGSVQTSAAGTTYTTTNFQNPPTDGSFASAAHLNLPTGTYLLAVSMRLFNSKNDAGQNNSRWIQCHFSGDSATPYSFDIAGFSASTLSFHSVLSVSSGRVDVICTQSSDGITIFPARLSATNLEGSVVVQ
jgi:hypothetical protein